MPAQLHSFVLPHSDLPDISALASCTKEQGTSGSLQDVVFVLSQGKFDNYAPRTPLPTGADAPEWSEGKTSCRGHLHKAQYLLSSWLVYSGLMGQHVTLLPVDDQRDRLKALSQPDFAASKVFYPTSTFHDVKCEGLKLYPAGR